MIYVQKRRTVLDMTSNAQPTGAAIRTLRKLAGLTLEQAASLAFTAPAYLSKVETGKLTPTVGYVADVTAAIAKHLRTSPHASEKVAA